MNFRYRFANSSSSSSSSVFKIRKLSFVFPSRKEKSLEGFRSVLSDRAAATFNQITDFIPRYPILSVGRP